MKSDLAILPKSRCLIFSSLNIKHHYEQDLVTRVHKSFEGILLIFIIMYTMHRIAEDTHVIPYIFRKKPMIDLKTIIIIIIEVIATMSRIKPMLRATKTTISPIHRNLNYIQQ